MSLQPHAAKEPGTNAFNLSDEDLSKDKYFHEVAELSNCMIAAHGREFAMGTLVLAARFIAEGRALSTQTEKPTESAACCGGAHHEGEHHHHDHKA